jgi:hypothetical protein
MNYGMFTFGKIYGSIQANSAIYFLKKIPLLGNLVPENIYKYKIPKYIFAIFGTLADIVKKAIGGNLGIYIMISLIPSMLSKIASVENWPDKSTLVFLYIVISCLSPALRQSNIFVSNAEDYTFINHFMINPARYYHYKLVKDFIIEGVLILPILIYLFKDFIIVSSLILTKLFFIGIGNVLFLEIYKRKQKIFNKIKRLLFVLFLTIIAYGLSLINIFYGATIHAGLLIAISICEIIGLILCFRYLFSFKEYKHIAVQYANNDTVTLMVSTVSTLSGEDATAFNIVDWEKNKAFLDANQNMDTWDYIHKAFKTRFKKAIFNHYKNQLTTNLFLCIVVGILIRFDILTIDTSNVLKYSPILITLILNLVFARQFLQMCFRYMDMPMLYQHMYDSQKVSSSMINRYLFLIRNGMISLVFFIFELLVLLLIAGIQIPINDFISVATSYILIYIIYETYDVIVYYLLQPYTVDLNIKNPIFKVLSYLEGLFYALILFARSNVSEIIPALLISLFVMLVVFIFARKHAYKTFRIK